MADVNDGPRNICPFLGIVDEEGKPAPPVDYPSLENQCFLTDRPEAILLTDQATFCLSAGHRHCPRLTGQSAPSRNWTRPKTGPQWQPVTPASDTSDPLTHAIAEMEAALEARRAHRLKRRRTLGWFSAIMVFLSSLLCGGLGAAYIGWQMVNDDGEPGVAGNVTTLASAGTQAPPPLYLIVTATSDAVTAKQNAGTVSQGLPLVFPPAVTPTSSAGGSNGSSSSTLPVLSAQGLSSVAQTAQSAAPGGAVAAEPGLDVLIQVPTRRPTPVLDLAIEVPTIAQATAQSSPSPTATPAPPLGTPVVVFGAEDEALESGKCTMVSWHVENVRAVYYENLGVDGHGEKEECVNDKPGDYTLTVVLPNGGTQYYTVTVGLVVPTETPTPTATFRPQAEPTATWTPVVPTSTPTPDMQYGVLLAVVDGSVQNCVSGKTCEVGLLITNTSLGIDDLSVQVLQSGAWSAKLCRLDGVCSDSKLVVASVGPGNTALVNLLIEVPRGVAGQTASYVVRAASERSDDGVGSEAVAVEIMGT